MDKYLFTDGTNGVKEAFSPDELLSFIKKAEDPDKSRVWIFGHNEWITAAELFKRYPSLKRSVNNIPRSETTQIHENRKSRFSFVKRLFFVAILVTCALLVFNFTDSGWQKSMPFISVASRPANVPVIDADSLRKAIETQRGRLLDKSTAANLRLRNNWPEQLLLQLKADRETKRELTRYMHVNVSIDNATGYNIDEAEIKLLLWNKGKVATAGTFRFEDIRYGKPAEHSFSGVFKGDSLSVVFQTIRAKAFNFCYDVEKENSSGNYNDRWFCRDGKQPD